MCKQTNKVSQPKVERNERKKGMPICQTLIDGLAIHWFPNCVFQRHVIKSAGEITLIRFQSDNYIVSLQRSSFKTKPAVNDAAKTTGCPRLPTHFFRLSPQNHFLFNQKVGTNIFHLRSKGLLSKPRRALLANVSANAP